MSFTKFLPLVLLCAFKTSSYATIPPLAFKEITGHLNPEKVHCSPTLGQIALDIGLPQNIRFYGPFERGEDKRRPGVRSYRHDHSKDPLWQLVKFLFPSAQGTFTAVATAKNNFASQVVSPSEIASLLNYAHEGRLKNFPENLKVIFFEKQEFSREKKKLFQQAAKLIQQSIKAEGDPFHPLYITELIISSFFVHHFNTQQDIWVLLRFLDGDIVPNKTAIPVTENLFTIEDLQILKEKKVPWDIDDFYLLSIKEELVNPLPYQRKIPPVSNGNCHFYDPLTKKTSSKTFADCAEITARHIINFLTYDPLFKIFNLNHLRGKALLQLFSFFEQQPPLLANSGNILLRSLFNKVVAGIKEVAYCQPFPEGTQTVNSNEIRSGFLNLMYVLEDITGKGHSSLPLQFSAEEEKIKWLLKNYKDVFTHLNSNYKYDMKVKSLCKGNLKSGQEDYGGCFEITVLNPYSSVSPSLTSIGAEKDTPLFCFDLNVILDKHTFINNLKILTPTAQLPNISILDCPYESHFNNKIKDNSLGILSALQIFNKFPEVPFLHYFFKFSLDDNENKKKLINRLTIIPAEFLNEISRGYPSLASMISNILHSISWTDLATITPKFTAKLLKLSSYFSEVLNKEVRALNFEGVDVEPELKFGKRFPCLETLELQNSRKLKTLEFDQMVPYLKELCLSRTPFEQIQGWQYIPHLQILSLQGVKNFKKLEITSNLPHLRMVDLSLSSIECIEGWQYTPHLQMLTLTFTKHLRNLKIDADLLYLKILDLNYSNINNIEGWHHFPHLEVLKVEKMPFLKKINLQFFKQLKRLEKTGTTLEMTREDSNFIQKLSSQG